LIAPKTPRLNVALGILQLARGRSAGLKQFGHTAPSLLASLAPLVASLLVTSVLLLLNGGGLPVVSDFLQLMCALLAPLVASFEVARRWGRQSAWLHYATAFCWCQWAVPLAFAALLLMAIPALRVGLSESAAAGSLVVGLSAYVLWLHWFLARQALGLSAWRAVGLVLIVNVFTALVVMVPQSLIDQPPSQSEAPSDP
jgi:hypothetical protein